MSAAEVEWVLNRLGAVVDDVATNYSLADEFDNAPVQVRRVDRNDSQIYDGSGDVDMDEPLPERRGKLERGCYIGARTASGSETPIGTEFDLDVDRVVGLRVEGLHAAQAGHVDPAGQSGVPWRNGEDGLIDRVREALYDQRTWPDAGGSDVTFTHLILTNESTPSSNWRDFYRWDVDVVFDGFETLP